MVETVMSAAQTIYAPWWILAGAALIVSVEAARSCKPLMWSDLGEEED
ncbi:hypothetical protein [Henriciella sp.]|jgi:hypothetical protein|nr:hypothetical protein [Henriciella sp.]|tara:strand:+ start:503 stop:646 length:144 start_codon:yes stop_codon:yes gene_type:complete